MGQAIVRRIGAGKHIVVADKNAENANAAVRTLYDAGFESEPVTTDISSRDTVLQLIETAQKNGRIVGFVNAAGVFPSQASVAAILKVDLYGTAALLKEFGKVVASGGAGVVISSQSGHRLGVLTQRETELLATTPTEKLLELEMLQPETVGDTLRAYQLSKRCNVLRTAFEATRLGKRGARINSVSPGIIVTPLANDELTGPRGAGYRTMIERCPVGRAGTPDEVATVAELLMSERGSFITGSEPKPTETKSKSR